MTGRELRRRSSRCLRLLSLVDEENRVALSFRLLILDQEVGSPNLASLRRLSR